MFHLWTSTREKKRIHQLHVGLKKSGTELLINENVFSDFFSRLKQTTNCQQCSETNTCVDQIVRIDRLVEHYPTVLFMPITNGSLKTLNQVSMGVLFLNQSPIESIMKVSDTVSYELTSVVYGDGSHFEARFLHDKLEYLYDGMRSEGKFACMFGTGIKPIVKVNRNTYRSQCLRIYKLL